MIKVSVIIPVYNAEAYLGECLDSVLGQLGVDLEVVCINDGSADTSPEILDGYSNRDCRVRVYHRRNVGSGAARNFGMEVATGDYLAFLDSDDRYAGPHVLRELVDAAENGGCDVALGNIQLFSVQNGEERFGVVYGPENFGIRGLCDYREYQRIYGYVAGVYRRGFLGRNGLKFPPRVRFEDPVFFVSTMAAAKRFAAVRSTVYLYRVAHKQVDYYSDGGRLLIERVDGVVALLELAETSGLDQVPEQVINDVWEALPSVACANILGARAVRLLEMLKRCGRTSPRLWRKLIFRLFRDDRLMRRIFGVCDMLGTRFVISKLISF